MCQRGESAEALSEQDLKEKRATVPYPIILYVNRRVHSEILSAYGWIYMNAEKVYITPQTIGVGTHHPLNYKTGCLTP